MKEKQVQYRIDKYLGRCGEDGDEFISGIILDVPAIKCGWCETVVADIHTPNRPNFCKECGVLLDWTNVPDPLQFD